MQEDQVVLKGENEHWRRVVGIGILRDNEQVLRIGIRRYVVRVPNRLAGVTINEEGEAV